MVSFVQKDNYSIDDLVEIVRLLRGEGGCPWDREQTHESIRADFIEEVSEAVEAIDLKDTALLREELGDVLLQVVFHSQIETENNGFDFNAVCDEVCKKLILRHPHVFGDVSVSNSEEVLKNWDKIKQKSKGQDSYTQTLESVSKALPALMRAEKVGKRAARAGMDFDNAQGAFDCIGTETEELRQAVCEGNQEAIADEMGDLFFSCVNTARKLGVNSELALTAATNKFIKRFAKVEELVRLDGIDMQSLSIDELDVYWRKAKNLFR